MAKKSAAGARLAPAEVPTGPPLSLAELRRATPVRATTPVPDGVFSPAPTRCLYAVSTTRPAIEVSRPERDQATVWCLDAGADTVLTPHWPGRHLEVLTRDDRTPWARTGSRSYRPRWADLDYLPRLLPYVSEREWLRAIAPRLSPIVVPQHTLAQEALRFSYPWCTIGRILSGRYSTEADGHTGTGVMVGPNLVLTASHLVPWTAPNDDWWMSFTPAWHAQHPTPAPFGWEYVERLRGHVYQSDGSPGGLDYVICKLRKPLGNKTGWMGTLSYGDEDDYEERSWISVGYPSQASGVPQVDFDIDIKDIDGDGDGLELETLYAKAFGGGWSGGPLWGMLGEDPYVIGIKSGWEVDGWDPARGVFAGGRHMVDLTSHGHANWAP